MFCESCMEIFVAYDSNVVISLALDGWTDAQIQSLRMDIMSAK